MVHPYLNPRLQKTDVSRRVRAWNKISTATVTERVYEGIRDRILAEELTPGESIRQDEISRKLGVSRTPVREALTRLATEGYVEQVPRRGFRVASKSISDMLRLYSIVATLERLAVKTSLPALGASDLARLRQLNEDQRVAMSKHDAPATIRLNTEFHRVLASQCGNPRLVGLLDELAAELMRLEIWSFAYELQVDEEQTCRAHDEIINAMERGDHEHALNVLEQDRLSAFEEYREEIARRDHATNAQSAP